MMASAAVLGLGLVVGGGATASADPYDCSAWPSGRSGYARCLNGTGEYRVTGYCEAGNQNFAPVKYPNWVRVGQLSSYTCAVGHSPASVGLQVR